MDTSIDASIIEHLGPLKHLVGVWEGDKGADVAPSDDRGTERNVFRERITFEPIPPVNNHEQHLFGLRYATIATRLGETVPFHEEVGYWLWDPAAKQVMKCFIVPRGVSVIAGGTVEPSARDFVLTANQGSATYGICSNPFLDSEFKTAKFDLKVTIHSADEWSYDEDTHIAMKGRSDVFHHTDRNRLRRVSGH